jgi:hypothetical protein
MSLFRNWRGRPRGLSDLPAEIRDADCYTHEQRPVREIHLSVDGAWWKIKFEDGTLDFWQGGMDSDDGTTTWHRTEEAPVFHCPNPPAPATAVGALLREQQAGMGDLPAAG